MEKLYCRAKSGFFAKYFRPHFAVHHQWLMTKERESRYYKEREREANRSREREAELRLGLKLNRKGNPRRVGPPPPHESSELVAWRGVAWRGVAWS